MRSRHLRSRRRHTAIGKQLAIREDGDQSRLEKNQAGRGGCVSSRSYSWTALVGFCATRSLIVGLGFGMLIAGAALAFGVAASSDSSSEPRPSSTLQRTFAGMITDSACQARHAPDSNKSPAACVRECISKGAKLMLVDGDKSYFLQGNLADLERFAGQRVKVAGTLGGTTIRVRSIAVE
jgi:hypothetical protein